MSRYSGDTILRRLRKCTKLLSFILVKLDTATLTPMHTTRTDDTAAMDKAAVSIVLNVVASCLSSCSSREELGVSLLGISLLVVSLLGVSLLGVSL